MTLSNCITNHNLFSIVFPPPPADVPKKRISYCRCWKSSTFPLCDGAHKQHNQGADDSVGPLVLVWDDTKEVFVPEGGSVAGASDNLDIKSIDSESPILHSSNGDSNGEFEKMGDRNAENISSDDHHSSIEMIDVVSFSADSKEDDDDEEEEDVDEDTVKLVNISQP